MKICDLTKLREETLHFDELIAIRIIQRDSIHTALSNAGVYVPSATTSVSISGTLGLTNSQEFTRRGNLSLTDSHVLLRPIERKMRASRIEMWNI